MKKNNTNTVSNITDNAKKILVAFMQDDFVSDHGWRSTEAAAWMDGFHEQAEMDGKVFAGTLAGMSKAKLVNCSSNKVPMHDRSFSLTDAGRAACEEMDKELNQEAPATSKKTKKAKKEVKVAEPAVKKTKKAKK